MIIFSSYLSFNADGFEIISIINKRVRSIQTTVTIIEKRQF